MFLENYKKGQERAKIVQERANELSNKAFIDSVRKKLGLKEQETKRAIYKFFFAFSSFFAFASFVSSFEYFSP